MTGLDLYLFAATESAFIDSRETRKGSGLQWQTSPYQVLIFQINKNSREKIFLIHLYKNSSRIFFTHSLILQGPVNTG